MSNAKIVKQLKALTESIEEMKISIQQLDVSKVAKAPKAGKESKASPKKAALKAEVASAIPATKMYRPSFFKKIFMEEREAYLNILWTQKEIKEALKLPEVASKKKEDDRYAKVARILYDVSIKDDVPRGRKAKFELAFAEFNG